jgi:TRAP transporter TAXI family solute receptor
MATDKVGSTFNAIGAGLAKIVTEGGKDRVVVKAFAGPDAYLGALQQGEVDLAALSASTAWTSYHGKNRAKRRYDKLRILRSADGGVRLTFLVAEKSGIRSVKDLKGRRLTAGFGGHAVIPRSMAGGLATAGLTWDDVQKVPVTGAVDGVQALGAGRVDASWTSYGMPIAREVHARIGVRYLPIEPGPKSLAALRKHIFPGVQLVLTRAEPKIGLPEDAYLISYDSYLASGPELDGKTVHSVLSALWDNTDKLVKVHRGLKGFSRERSVTDIPMVPYHPAAIAFYKAKGVWTAEAQAANDKVVNAK